MLHQLLFTFRKTILILSFLFTFFSSNSQENISIKYSDKLIFDNWKDGYYKDILGSNDNFTYVLYNPYLLANHSKKQKILAFDKILKIANTIKLIGYHSNKKNDKTIKKIKRLTFVNSFVSDKKIIIIWEQQIKDKKNIYYESFDERLNLIKGKTLISSFKSSIYTSHYTYYRKPNDYVVYCNNDKIILINNSSSDVKNASTFHYKICDINFNIIKESNFYIDNDLIGTNEYIAYTMLHFNNGEILFECNNTILSINIEDNEVNHYSPDFAGKHQIVSTQAFVIGEKVFIIGLYGPTTESRTEINTSDDGNNKENENITGLFYDEVSNSSKSIQFYEFSAQEKDSLYLDKDYETHFGIKIINNDNYIILFKTVYQNFVNIVSINPNSKINWVKSIENGKEFNILENQKSLISVECTQNNDNVYKSINFIYISDDGTITKRSSEIDMIKKFKHKKTQYKIVKNNNKVYIILKKKVIKPIGLILKLASIPIWPASPFTFTNGSLYRHNGQIIEISCHD